MYEVVLTREAQRAYEQADLPLARRPNRCFERLAQNPYEHPNIKRLRGPLAGYWRYRLGNWRVVYGVDEDQHLVTVIIIAHRSRAYR